jgi:hypothetical protein
MHRRAIFNALVYLRESERTRGWVAEALSVISAVPGWF